MCPFILSFSECNFPSVQPNTKKSLLRCFTWNPLKKTWWDVNGAGHKTGVTSDEHMPGGGENARSEALPWRLLAAHWLSAEMEDFMRD